MLNAGIGLAMGQTLGGRLAGGIAGSGAGTPVAPSMPPPLPVASVYHYAGADNQQLTLSPADVAARVKAGPGARHLVWKEGMAGWVSAEEVPEIAALLRAGPPPLPPG
jgi:hypothetical protein